MVPLLIEIVDDLSRSISFPCDIEEERMFRKASHEEVSGHLYKIKCRTKQPNRAIFGGFAIAVHNISDTNSRHGPR